jgi:hypothetical protein
MISSWVRHQSPRHRQHLRLAAGERAGQLAAPLAQAGNMA